MTISDFYARFLFFYFLTKKEKTILCNLHKAVFFILALNFPPVHFIFLLLLNHFQIIKKNIHRRHPALPPIVRRYKNIHKKFHYTHR